MLRPLGCQVDCRLSVGHRSDADGEQVAVLQAALPADEPNT